MYGVTMPNWLATSTISSMSESRGTFDTQLGEQVGDATLGPQLGDGGIGLVALGEDDVVDELLGPLGRVAGDGHGGLTVAVDSDP